MAVAADLLWKFEHRCGHTHEVEQHVEPADVEFSPPPIPLECPGCGRQERADEWAWLTYFELVDTHEFE